MSALPEQAINCDPLISIEAFEAGSVDPEQFGHEAHVYVAWLYLQDYELKDAIAKFCAALRRLTVKLAIESKYHETITWFFMILINERIQKTKTDDWRSFRQQNSDLVASNPSIISRHYSVDRLGSRLARKQFLLPDLLPL